MAEQQSLDLSLIEQLLERMNVGTLFGPVTKAGEVAVMPVAKVSASFGFGHGYGEASKSSPDGDKSSSGNSGGGGGGGMGKATPVGYLHFSADGVRFKAIDDGTRIALAGIFLAGWMVFWITATVRAFAKSR